MKKSLPFARIFLILLPMLALSCTLFTPERVPTRVVFPNPTLPATSTRPIAAATTVTVTATLDKATVAMATGTSSPLASLTPVKKPTQLDTPPPITRYDVVETIHLVNQGPQRVTRLMLYAVLVNSWLPFQKVLSTSLSPKEQSVQTDDDGNRIAAFEFKELPPGSDTVVTLRYQVEINPYVANLGACQGPVPASPLTGAEKYLEVDSKEIREASASLTKGKSTACEKARAIYDFVGDTLTYSGYNPQDIGALKTLSIKQGDCTEYADLFIALSRAAGLPARYIDGVTCCTSGRYQPSDTKHNWAEVYLPGTGWVTIDPTWGRFQADRERYFARHPVGHIVVGYGRNNTALDGFHYYYFRYWRDDEATKVVSEEEWSIIRRLP